MLRISTAPGRAPKVAAQADKVALVGFGDGGDFVLTGRNDDGVVGIRGFVVANRNVRGTSSFGTVENENGPGHPEREDDQGRLL